MRVKKITVVVVCASDALDMYVMIMMMICVRDVYGVWSTRRWCTVGSSRANSDAAGPGPIEFRVGPVR